MTSSGNHVGFDHANPTRPQYDGLYDCSIPLTVNLVITLHACGPTSKFLSGLLPSALLQSTNPTVEIKMVANVHFQPLMWRSLLRSAYAYLNTCTLCLANQSSYRYVESIERSIR